MAKLARAVTREDLVDTHFSPDISEDDKRHNKKVTKREFEKLQRNMRHGVLVALTKEYAAVEAIFGPAKKWPNASDPDNPVHYVVFDTDTGPRPVLIAGVTEAGIAQAASKAALIKWTNRHVNKIIMVGIAAGQPDLADADKDVRLGDIVVSEKVVQHDHLKITDGVVEHRGKNLQLPDANLLQAVSRLRAKFQLTGHRTEELPWTKHIVEGTAALNRAKRPAVDQNDDKRTYDEASATNGRRPGEPFVHVGTIASGSLLLKDAGIRDKLAKELSAIAYEMEGAGLAIASATSDFKYVVVRGICDYADTNKDDEWQPYAALVATSFARALLEAI